MEVEEIVEKFKDFLETVPNKENPYLAHLNQHISEGKYRLTVSFKDIVAYDVGFYDLILDEPEDTIKAFELACESLIERTDKKIKSFRIRIKDTPKSIELRVRDIRSKSLNKFLTFEGIIESKSDVRPNIIACKFECPQCGNIISILQLDKTLKEPTQCGCGRKGKFKLMAKDLTDAFTISLQELPEQVDYDPELKRLNVIFKDDLTESKFEERIYQGIRIRIIGILHEVELTTKMGTKSTKMDYLLEANYFEITENSFFDMSISQEELHEIEEISKNKNALKILADKLYFPIYGHDEVKESLVLQLFGGVSDYTRSPKIRGETHLMLIGEAGTAKTDLLKLQEKYALKSASVNSKTASGVGIVGIPEKNEIIGGWSFRVGPVPRAHKGICTIDEFNTLDEEDKDILLEPMENGTVSINKASISRRFNAQVSFLLACNPTEGYFDPYKGLYEQFGISQPLHTRLDIAWVFKKSNDKEFEKKKAFTILNRQYTHKPEDINKVALFIKKYVSLAKKIKPELSKEMREEYIPNLYSEMSVTTNVSYESDEKLFPMTARFVNVIKRLAEAKARVHLKSIVGKDEVDYALKLLNHSLSQTGIDPITQKMDVQVMETGVSSSERSILSILRESINELAIQMRTIPIEDVLAKAKSKGNFSVDVLEENLDKMKHKGEWFEPRSGFLQKI